MQNNQIFSTSMISNATTKVKVRASEDTANSGRAEEWWDAQHRLLLYLQALKVPAERSLEIALEALNRARKDQGMTEGSNITGNAMLALRNVLAEKGLDCLEQVFCSPEDFCNMNTDQDSRSPAKKCAGTPGYSEMVFSPSGDLPVMPPLNRSSMRAEVIERSIFNNLANRFWRKSEQK